MTEPASRLDAALRTATVTREIVVEPDALSALADVIFRRLGDRPITVVADVATLEAAGRDILPTLAAAGIRLGDAIVLERNPRPKPLVETAERIARQLSRDGSAAVAIGSGVVNDLTKYGSALARQPFVSVATAASMDGYAASGAALLDAGFKRTLACQPPVAVLGDLAVLAKAPHRMAAWGYGDLAGKVVAGADWILADALEVEAMNPGPFATVQDPLHEWLGAPERLRQGDQAAIGGLLSGLLVSGLAMQEHGNSRPASGSEHQFSHLWEMEGLTIDGEAAAHGACVGVGCVAMLALYEWLLAQPLDGAVPAVDADPKDVASDVRAAFPIAAMAQSALVEVQAKPAGGAARARRVALLRQRWPDLRQRLAVRLPSASAMQASLCAAGAAAHPLDLGVSLERLAGDHRRARMIRRRYTVLDVVDDLGWTDRAIAGLFGPGGFWTRQRQDQAFRPAKETST